MPAYPPIMYIVTYSGVRKPFPDELMTVVLTTFQTSPVPEPCPSQVGQWLLGMVGPAPN